MYADDLVFFANSEEDLQIKLNKLSEYCENWQLQINTRKTKCMVFNSSNRLCRLNIYLNGERIENVKTMKYLGFTIGAKNCSFTGTINDLCLKAKRAIFALDNRIKLSLLPVSLALKIVSSQTSPILLYGAEVWGAHCGFTFENWDKNINERTHTQFLKRVLGSDIHSPNLMVRA